MKKKNFLFITSLTALLLLASCGKGGTSTNSSTSNDDTSLTSEDTSDTSSTTSNEETTSEGSSEEEQDVIVKGYLHDSYDIVDGNPLMKKENETEFKEVTESFVDNGVKYWNFVNKATIKIKLKGTSSRTPTGLLIDEEESFLINEDGYVTFEIDTSDEFISITTQARGLGVELIASKSAHLTPKFYFTDKKTEIDTCGVGEVVYVKVEGVTEDIFVKDITVRYSNPAAGTTNKSILNTLDADGFYSFIGMTAEYGMTVTVTEIDNNKFMGEEFVNTYVVLDRSVFAPNHAFTSLKEKEITIQKNGEIYWSGDEKKCGAVEDKGAGTELILANYGKGYYEKGVFLAGNKALSPLTSPYKGDELICVGKEKEEDTLAMYSVNAELINIDGNTYMISEFYRSEVLYKTVVLDYQNQTMYVDPTITYSHGTSFTDAKVVYEVKDGSNSILKVSYSGVGGISNRIALASPCGVYSGAKGTLLLPNTDSAFLDESEYMWSISENAVTLTNAEKKYVLTIDQEAMTYVVTSEEDLTSNVPSFRGLTFKGKIYNTWDEYNTDIKMVFANYESDDQIIGQLVYGSYPAHTFGFVATFDCNTNVLNCKITSETYKEGAVGKSFSFYCENGKMTARTGFNENTYNLIYNKQGVVLSCSDFVM